MGRLAAPGCPRCAVRTGRDGRLARFDDTAASAWAASLPAGPAHDGAAAGLVTVIAATEPDAAWQWAASIADQRLAAQAYIKVAGQWGNQAPAEFIPALTM